MTKGDLPTFEVDSDVTTVNILNIVDSTTETIDLNSLITPDLTVSGSFDLRGVEATSLGKLLESLPIPALVIDRFHDIIFENALCGNQWADRQRTLRRSFVDIFLRRADGEDVKLLMDRIFLKRKHEVKKASLQLGDRKLWGKMHLRPLRVGSERFILVLIEDLTVEKNRLLIQKRHQRELQQAHDELEKRVEERVAELSETNERLRQEITERERAESRLKLAGQIVASSNEAMLVTDVRGRIVDVNQAFTKITGYCRKEVLGKGHTLFVSGQQDKRFYKDIWRSLVKNGTWKGEVWDRRKSGEAYPRLMSLSPVRNDEGKVTNYVGIFSDITKMKQSELRLHRLAHYDHLTGLPNRVLFHDRLQRALLEADRDKHMVAIMLLDLDRFKNINDTLGHRFGDQLLVSVGERLTACLRRSDTAARLGGDEFVVILSGISDVHGAARVARNLAEALSKPFALDGREVFVTTSIGITLFPDDGAKVGILLQNADTALHHAKEQGKNNFQFFSKQMNKNVLKRLNLEQTLRSAIAGKKLLLHYQPVVDMSTGRVASMEALLRWRHRSGRVLSAGNLIPAAEETGLIVPIGEWVLRSACRQNKAWQEMGFPRMRVAVNVSGRQLKQQDLGATVLRILDETDLDPECLEIELTESVMMENADTTIELLANLKRHGVHIAVDDFGTGYSSLSYLRHFPIDNLKIDRSFIKDVAYSSYEREIVKAVLAVAHSLHLKVVAEGVETREHVEFLRQHSCDRAQGYYWAPAVPVNVFTRLLRADCANSVQI